MLSPDIWLSQIFVVVHTFTEMWKLCEQFVGSKADHMRRRRHTQHVLLTEFITSNTLNFCFLSIKSLLPLAHINDFHFVLERYKGNLNWHDHSF